MVYGALTAKTAVLFFTSIAIAAGQSPTGSIGGVVRDPSGAAVSTALVKAITTAKGLTRTIIASAEGDYSFPALLAGEYEVSVEASGFQRIVRQVWSKPAQLQRQTSRCASATPKTPSQ
jgi:Carboxypeptidase regulatory-like domain